MLTASVDAICSVIFVFILLAEKYICKHLAAAEKCSKRLILTFGDISWEGDR